MWHLSNEHNTYYGVRPWLGARKGFIARRLLSGQENERECSDVLGNPWVRRNPSSFSAESLRAGCRARRFVIGQT